MNNFDFTVYRFVVETDVIETLKGRKGEAGGGGGSTGDVNWWWLAATKSVTKGGANMVGLLLTAEMAPSVGVMMMLPP